MQQPKDDTPGARQSDLAEGDLVMDKVLIPEEDVVALENVRPDVAGLRVLIVNVYAISGPGGDWMLIDCGLPYSQARIRRWTEQHFGAGARPTAILLTHG